MPPSIATPPGTLYVVATPIGNLEDITLRALRVLAEVALIAAEDTRQTGKLLRRHQIDGRLVAYHEHNEAQKAAELIQRLQSGQSVAVVSDAGTPSVSDPGFRLVQAALGAGLPVVPVPGPSAAVTALSVSGLPTDAFVFVGFPPRKPGARRRLLERLAPLAETLIFYESPHRIAALLEQLAEVMGDRPAVLGREMTKIHEEFIRGHLKQIHDLLIGRPAVRGEVTLLVAGAAEAEPVPQDELIAALEAALEDQSATFSKVVQDTARRFDLPRRKVYQMALTIRRRPADPSQEPEPPSKTTEPF